LQFINSPDLTGVISFFFIISNQLCNTHWNSHTHISAPLLDLLFSYVS